MNHKLNALGWILVILGLLIAVLSRYIVFPGLEILLGIETIVSSENVIYEPDGSYCYTNPGAMIHWILLVAGIGLSIALCGVAILMVVRSKTRISE